MSTCSASSATSYINKSVALSDTSRKTSPIRRRLNNETTQRSIVESSPVKYVIDAVIILNVLQMGLSLDIRGQGWDTLWTSIDLIVLATFLCEMLMLLRRYGGLYFQSRQNILDFTVVVVSVVDVCLKFALRTDNFFSIVQALRLLRLVRITKLFKVFPAFQVILHSMHASFVTISWFIVFLGIIIYVAAVACVVTFGTRDSGYPGYNDDAYVLRTEELKEFNNYKYFGTVWRAILTLFNLSLLSELPSTLRPINALQPWATVLFALFILVMTLCILNSVVGIVVQKTVEAILQHEQRDSRTRKTQMSALSDLTHLMFQLDVDGSDEISREELVDGSDNPSLIRLLREVDLPAGFTLEDLFCILDADGSGILSRSEFIGGLFRLLFSNEFQRQCLARLGEAQLRQTILTVKTEIMMEMHQEHRTVVHEIRKLHQLLNPSREDSSSIDLEPPVLTKVTSSDQQQQRSARLDAYLLAAKDFPELQKVFNDCVPTSPKANVSSPDQMRASESPVHDPSACYSWPHTPQSSSSTDRDQQDCENTWFTAGSVANTRAHASSGAAALPVENEKPTMPASMKPRDSPCTIFSKSSQVL